MNNDEFNEQLKLLNEEIIKLNKLVSDLANRVMASERKIHRLSVK